jgi:sensory rhodopsin
MLEIAQVKGVGGGARVQLLYLTAIVMGTGFLAARDLTFVRWAYVGFSALAYLLLVRRVLLAQAAGSGWVHSYIFFGWTLFPIVFVLAPTGVGLINAALANLLYLLLDVYTKIVFNVQLSRKA